jgi:hypothetical protein
VSTYRPPSLSQRLADPLRFIPGGSEERGLIAYCEALVATGTVSEPIIGALLEHVASFAGAAVSTVHRSYDPPSAGSSPNTAFSVEPGFDATVVEHAKLVELGMRRKPAKVTLDGHVQSLVDEMLATVAGELEDPQRTLAIRYAIKVFTDALPKRASK